MTIDVVTFFTPRPGTKHSVVDYGKLLKWQKASAETFGHRHILISDHIYKGMNCWRPTVPLPQSLMKAILVGQIDYIEHGWDGTTPTVLADIDCLIARSLDGAFDGQFDLGLTSRPHDSARINNGAMYLGGNKAGVAAFFKQALEYCGDHWGGDQEAISRAAEPIPPGHGNMQTEDHNGLRLRFLPMLNYAVSPDAEGIKHVNANPFIIHFKGLKCKPWMKTYAQKFILQGDHTA